MEYKHCYACKSSWEDLLEFQKEISKHAYLILVFRKLTDHCVHHYVIHSEYHGAWYELQGERDKRVTKGYDFLDRSLV
jgi:hypothetical protein